MTNTLQFTEKLGELQPVPTFERVSASLIKLGRQNGVFGPYRWESEGEALVLHGYNADHLPDCLEVDFRATDSQVTVGQQQEEL